MSGFGHRPSSCGSRASRRTWPRRGAPQARSQSPVGRAASERYLRLLRSHAPAFRPKPSRRRDFIPPILIFGTSRTAESLRKHALFAHTIAWEVLENQRANAHADYCLGIAALGSGTALSLLDYWWEGKD